ncbi:branched-chain amino acid ABC transporter permease [Limnoglobus roseus]|uniref:Branched-chain amino acid ABC transporter permease n=1 Tax=Limnoglobus roseus TaxID=2598579 RepID=A0A5C1AFR5_9BACT|nr:branched-chain amino acid ABC transporter permease [Limnoglobus roseus]QEL18269.1 branched-chain amino acid ABC transporter permease [Limnoglobus roseus]
MTPLFAALDTQALTQYLINGLSYGMLIALVALGYTMVYGIVELINFAHGDLFMLGAFLGWTIITAVFKVSPDDAVLGPVALLVCFVIVPAFCGLLNFSVDRVIYRPLRKAPRLAPLVSAIGVSFIFQNLGLFWGGPQDVDFPKLVSNKNLLGLDATVRFTYQDLLVVGVTIPLMIALTVFVKLTPLGKAMRATAQNPTAAQLMGINTERVIATTFILGGTLAGFGAMIYGLTINSIHYQMGFLVGLYAFTAAVLGGIGNIPGAVLGGLLIGLVRSLGSAYVGERWTGALIFAMLIVVLVFRPAGLLGARVREKV